MSKEAMKLALEALEAHADIGIKADKAITALREALAEQPAQRTWAGLTDEEMDDCWNKLFGTGNYNRRNVYRDIEAKLKEKNT